MNLKALNLFIPINGGVIERDLLAIIDEVVTQLDEVTLLGNRERLLT